MLVNKSQLRNVLNACLFNPKQPGILKPLVDTIYENPSYALYRAKELISEYQAHGKLNRLFIVMITLCVYIARHPDFGTVENGPIQPAAPQGTRS